MSAFGHPHSAVLYRTIPIPYSSSNPLLLPLTPQNLQSSSTHTHTRTTSSHPPSRIMPDPVSTPPISPKISLQEDPPPPLLTDTHPTPYFTSASPPHQNHTSSNPTTQGGRRPRQTQDGENGLIAFQLQNLGTRIPYHCCNPPRISFHPGHPPTPSILIRVSLRLQKL